MNSPGVSVLLPFRDAASTLDAAITSIHTQSSSDWELLLIDNASTDDSGAIAQDRSRRDPRIRVVEEPAIGIASALNTGLKHARAPLIARMDADDISHPDRLTRQVAYMKEHPEIGVLGTRTAFSSTVAENRGMRAFVDRQNAIISPHQHYIKRFVDVPLAHPTVMFRRDLIERFGGYDTRPVPEDYELWLRWMHQGVRFSKLPEVLLTWNDRPDRLSRSHGNYSKEAFQRVRTHWLAKWLLEKNEGPVIIAGTSKLCRDRAAALEATGIRVTAFTDVHKRPLPGRDFIPHDQLPPAGKAIIVSFISQRGTGERIADFLTGRGLVEGEDFILAV